VHPEVARLRDEAFREAEAVGSRWSSPISRCSSRSVCEDGFDVVVLVDAPEAVPRAASCATAVWSVEEAQRMIDAQMPAAPSARGPTW
jgi:hypothetical protein